MRSAKFLGGGGAGGDRARERAASGVEAIGAQTDEQLRRLEAKQRG